MNTSRCWQPCRPLSSSGGCPVRTGRLSGIAWLALSGVVCQAGDLASATSPPALPGAAGSILSVVRVLGALVLVFAVFFAGLWMFRNWQRVLVRQGRAPKLAVIEARSLGQRHTLFVVGYEQQRLLVAASPTGVSLLTNLPPAEPEPALANEPETQPRPHFTQLLLRALAQKP